MHVWHTQSQNDLACCELAHFLQLIRMLPPHLAADVMALHPQRKRRVGLLPPAVDMMQGLNTCLQVGQLCLVHAHIACRHGSLFAFCSRLAALYNDCLAHPKFGKDFAACLKVAIL